MSATSCMRSSSAHDSSATAIICSTRAEYPEATEVRNTLSPPLDALAHPVEFVGQCRRCRAVAATTPSLNDRPPLFAAIAKLRA